MKIHLIIPHGLKNHFEQELQMAQNEFALGNLQLSWRHLERAHILGQAWPVQHTKAHWKMICFALRIKSSKEILGQIPRLIFGGIKSFVGEIPVGNTGGANVPPLKSMDIPIDLLQILNKYRS
ncbi:MAG: DUF3703 domain-containing protein [Bacteroidia bacterium]|nr:DUF3703 domain-containing protein [Bacteroidia bacterium]